MATVEISNWKVAKMFGLEYLGEADIKDEHGDMRHMYYYDFHGKDVDIEGWQFECEEDAHEEAAKVVLTAIGKAGAARWSAFD